MKDFNYPRLGRFLFLFNTKGITIKHSQNSNDFIRILCITLTLLYLTELLLPADHFHNFYFVNLVKSIKLIIIVLSSILIIIDTYNKERIELAYYGYLMMVLVFMLDILTEILIIFNFKTMIFDYIFLIQFCLFLFKLFVIKLNIIWYVFFYMKSVLDYMIKRDLNTLSELSSKINEVLITNKTEIQDNIKELKN